MCLDIPPLEGDCNPRCLDASLRGGPYLGKGGNECCDFDPNFRGCVNGYVATSVPFEACVSTICGRRGGHWCYNCSTSPPGTNVRVPMNGSSLFHFPSSFKMEMFAQATER